MTAVLEELVSMIEAKRGDEIAAHDIAHGELTVTVAPASLPAFIGFLKTDGAMDFTTLVDITAVDYPEREKRFELVYHFLSMRQNTRIRVKAHLRENELAPSIINHHQAANWFEREVFDMYGIMFSGHPDLRRMAFAAIHCARISRPRVTPKCAMMKKPSAWFMNP